MQRKAENTMFKRKMHKDIEYDTSVRNEMSNDKVSSKNIHFQYITNTCTCNINMINIHFIANN